MASDLVTGTVTQVARVAGPAQPAPNRGSGQRGEPSPAGGSPAAQEAQVEEALQEAMAGLGELIQSQRRSLQFSVDAASGRTVIRVLDAQTQETIRQIPAEEVLNLSRWLRGSAGALINATA
jgi:flagellar protein FlaG